MKEIIILAIIAALLFACFVATLTAGLLKKSSRLIITSIAALILFTGVSAWAGLKFAGTTYHRLSEALKPRTGAEIYAALFGKPGTECVKVREQQDQYIPKIDYAIWLHFETCPEELNRILSLHEFDKYKTATKGWSSGRELGGENWFKPELLGDSILIFEYKDERSNGQTIYSNLAQTEAYCIDVLD